MRRGQTQNGAGFAKNNLIELVGEFNRESEEINRAVAAIQTTARNRGDFLMKKILGAAERYTLNLDFLGVGHLFGGEREKAIGFPGGRRGRRKSPKIKSDDGQNNRERGTQAGKVEPSAFQRRLVGRRDVRFIFHEIGASKGNIQPALRPAIGARRKRRSGNRAASGRRRAAAPAAPEAAPRACAPARRQYRRGRAKTRRCGVRDRRWRSRRVDRRRAADR